MVYQVYNVYKFYSLEYKSRIQLLNIIFNVLFRFLKMYRQDVLKNNLLKNNLAYINSLDTDYNPVSIIPIFQTM